MPLYEYRCRKCENVFEYIQSLSEGPKRKCEECAGRLEKLVSRAGFVLKGSGWYETDFKGGGKKPSDSKEGSPSSSKKEGAGGDSKESASPKSSPKKDSKTPSSSGKD